MQNENIAQYLFDLYYTESFRGTNEDKYRYYEVNIDCVPIENIVASLITQLGEETSICIQTKEQLCSVSCTFLPKSEKVTIILNKSYKVNAGYSKEENIWVSLSEGITFKLVVFGDNNTVYCENNNKLIPCSIKKLVSFCGDDLKKVPFIKRLFINLISFYAKGNQFVNDIIRTIEHDSCFLIPLNFNDLHLYHNKKEFFSLSYKMASNIGVNFNKRDMNLSYLIIKSWTMVKPESRNKLLNIVCFDLTCLRTSLSSHYKSYCWSFLEALIISKLKVKCETESEYSQIRQIINDYFEMCALTKEKINLSMYSAKRIVEEHDHISEKHYMKKTPIVKIKKDTKFKDLRKILPDEFEWIKTRKRLIQETVMQHHCVWSYAERINNDTSQIYSYVDAADTRYTLEFKVRRNKYCLVQVQGKYNMADTKDVKKYVNNILNQVKT